MIRSIRSVYIMVVIFLAPLMATAQIMYPIDNLDEEFIMRNPRVFPVAYYSNRDSRDKVLDQTQCPNAATQIDIIDIINRIFKGKPPRTDPAASTPYKQHISVIPAVGYTLSTSLTFAIYANDAFYTGPDANLSTITTSLAWSVNNQIMFPMKTSIWWPDNKYYLTTDWRFLTWPSYTYGLGGYTRLSDGYRIDYNAVRLHQSFFVRVAPDVYLGLGYSLEYYWDIGETDPPAGRVTDFQRYGLHGTEFESAPTLNFLYDSRRNTINPLGGGYANVQYIPNLTIFGNSTSWQSLIIDLRKYFRFPAESNNVLAFWNYDWLTPSGTPPYLMLPNTGGDPYTNTGRGYIQGRYRGRNMLYLEGEYRFGLTRNGLLGAVVFANAESFTEEVSRRFETIAPAVGAGLRIKLNKFSRTNVALDYGFGKGGSNGLFVSVGEVF